MTVTGTQMDNNTLHEANGANADRASQRMAAQEINALAGAFYREMFAAYQRSFDQHMAQDYEQMRQVAFQGVYLAMLTRLAAVLAIDIGMDIPRFVAIAAENHVAACNAAPKWGAN